MCFADDAWILICQISLMTNRMQTKYLLIQQASNTGLIVKVWCWEIDYRENCIAWNVSTHAGMCVYSCLSTIETPTLTHPPSHSHNQSLTLFILAITHSLLFASTASAKLLWKWIMVMINDIISSRPLFARLLMTNLLSHHLCLSISSCITRYLVDFFLLAQINIFLTWPYWNGRCKSCFCSYSSCGEAASEFGSSSQADYKTCARGG